MTLKERIEANYRLTKVTTEDYGDHPSAGKRYIGQLARIPDGSRWDALPQVFNIAVPEGTRPGAVFTMTLEARKADQ